MAETYTEWAKEIINRVGTYGANKLITALDTEISKINFPEDFEEENKEGQNNA